MKPWIGVPVASLVLVAARAETQLRPPVGLDQSAIRVVSEGNELIAIRNAPVAYSTLEQIVTSIPGAHASPEEPVRVRRVSPPEEIDYHFCVTNGATLALCERIHTLAAAQR